MQVTARPTISSTDGANTVYADNIVFNRWSITNGDDAIAIKANSTNIGSQIVSSPMVSQ